MTFRPQVKAEAIATYALCGFSNFGTISIMLGFFAVIAPAKLSTAGLIH